LIGQEKGDYVPAEAPVGEGVPCARTSSRAVLLWKQDQQPDNERQQTNKFGLTSGESAVVTNAIGGMK